MPNTFPKYLVSVDVDVNPEMPDGCEWVSENNGWLFYHDNNLNPILTEEYNLTYSIMSSSLAVNFAILRGYKEILLAGIDLIEDARPFFHYDGIMNIQVTEKFMCRTEKEFIKKICKENNIKIYNLNSDVDWLQTKDIGIIKG